MPERAKKMVEKVGGLTFFVPAQVGLDVGDKFGEGIGEAGHVANGGLVHPAIFRGISQVRRFDLPAGETFSGAAKLFNGGATCTWIPLLLQRSAHGTLVGGQDVPGV
jgi:hypothetical protein